VVTCTGHDEEIRGGLLECGPAFIEAVDDADELDVVGARRGRRLDSRAIGFFVGGDERPDRRVHRRPPRDLSTATGGMPKRTVSTVTMSGLVGAALARGLSTAQRMPLSAVN